eukprot:5227538-Pyramimonas_sp.AAC.1
MEEGRTSHSIISTFLAWRPVVRSRSSRTCSFYLSYARRHCGVHPRCVARGCCGVDTRCGVHRRCGARKH